MFPSISRLFFRWRGPKSIAKLVGGAMAEFAPSGSATDAGTWSGKFCRAFKFWGSIEFGRIFIQF